MHVKRLFGVGTAIFTNSAFVLGVVSLFEGLSVIASQSHKRGGVSIKLYTRKRIVEGDSSLFI